MRWAFVLLMTIHALLHLLGFATAFGLSKTPQLSQPIVPWLGVVWLTAAVTILASLVALFAWPRGWWAIAGVGLAVSQWVIASSWPDAKFGTLANALLLLGVLFGVLTRGPTSFRATFDAEVATGRAAMPENPSSNRTPISERDLVPLPRPVQRYLRATGALGKPPVLRYRLRFRGRIRASPSDRWMSFDAEQQSFVEPSTRLFLMDASMRGVPVQAFHRFVGPSARMQVKLAGLFAIADASGSVMDRSETVTIFNDMCILAPGSLLSPNIRWQAIDERTARAHFTRGGQTVSALLHFDDEGLLRNFVSDDRERASRDGKSFAPLRFSTPLRDYRQYESVRLASHGEARWHAPAPEGEFSYGEFNLLEISYD